MKDYQVIKIWKDDVKSKAGRIIIKAGWHYRILKNK